MPAHARVDRTSKCPSRTWSFADPLGPISSSQARFCRSPMSCRKSRCGPVIVCRSREKAPVCRVKSATLPRKPRVNYSPRHRTTVCTASNVCFQTDTWASFCGRPWQRRRRVWLRLLSRQPVKPCHLMSMGSETYAPRGRPASYEFGDIYEDGLTASMRILEPYTLKSGFAYCHGARETPVFNGNTPTAKDRP